MYKRNSSIDFVKFIAIILVIGVHTTANQFVTQKVCTHKWNMILPYRCIFAPSVLLFFMCSGALLFQKEKKISISKIYTKYIKRMIKALFFWAAVYEVLNIFTGYMQLGVVEKTSIEKSIKNLIFFNHNYQLYFIYLMVLFYAVTPVIKTIIDNSSENMIEYILFLWFIAGILIPTLSYIKFFQRYYRLYSCFRIGENLNIIFYGILGYYILEKKDRFKRQIYLFIFLLGFFATVISVYIIGKNTNEVSFAVLNPLSSLTVMIMTIGIYGFIISNDFSFYKSSLVKNVSNSTFCIFLIHDVFIRILKSLDITMLTFPILISVPMMIILIFIPSYLSYRVFEKIDFVKKHLI